MNRKTKSTTIFEIKVDFPFWLSWAKRFMCINVKKIETLDTLKGQKIDAIIIDEAIR